MDNSDYVSSPDRERINMKENYEVEYWSKLFGVNREQLQKAVNAVGTSVKEVEKYLK